ncbi:MAG: histidine kinase dimerization/phospho-acceptor domain-containing protein [Gaiellaceae bacterium]
MAEDLQFARLVALACHDIRTPLATVHGFAKTLARMPELEDPVARYVGMIDAASDQIADLLDELGLAARIAEGRYEPALRELDTLELARTVAERLGDERVRVTGDGAAVHVDVEAVERGVTALVRSALRHGGLEQVDVRVEGPELGVSPITDSSEQVVTGRDLRDLGAAVAVRLLEALGGSASVEDETLRVRLPQAS